MTRCNECGHSDCCGPLRENDVEALQARIAELEQQLAELREALEKLARLGNGDRYGNSEGNVIAQNALALQETPHD